MKNVRTRSRKERHAVIALGRGHANGKEIRTTFFGIILILIFLIKNKKQLIFGFQNMYYVKRKTVKRKT